MNKPMTFEEPTEGWARAREPRNGHGVRPVAPF